MTDIQSSIGIHQLRKLDSFIEARTRLAKIYEEAFSGMEEFEIPADKLDCRHAWHLYGLRLNLNTLEINRDQFIVEMRNMGVGTSVHFIPIPLHPFFSSYAHLPQNQCPRALSMYPRLVSLPLYPAMTEAQAEYVAQSAIEIVRKNRKKKLFSTGCAEAEVSGVLG
jgi:dTDP-4-amino-4,6-dideoxygalactose transaminase